MEAYDAELCAAELCAAEARDQLAALTDQVEALAARGTEAHDVERLVFEKLLAIGLEVMKVYFARMGTGDVGDAVLVNGQLLKRQKQLQPRDYLSIFGKLDVVRTRYRARAGESVFPLDRKANLPERCYSYVLQAMTNRLDADMTFREGSSYLTEFFGLGISESVLIDLAKDASRDYETFYEERRPPEAETEGEILAVSFDGKGVPMIRKEAVKLKARLGKGEKRQRKKEALVGLGYTVDRNPRTPEDLAESLVDPEAARARRKKQGEGGKSRPKAQNIRRLASLSRPKQEVFDAIRDDALRRDPDRERPLAVLMDGARSLEKSAREVFGGWPVVYFILDIIHVLEYLWEAANALYGEGKPAGRTWVQAKLTEILKGRVGYVLGGLRQILTKRNGDLKKSKVKALEKAITYFENHRDLMRYDEYLEAGLPVATSLAESTCGSLVKHRMEGSGKRWGIPGAEAVLKLRSLKMSNGNDLIDFAKFRARQERNRLYGRRQRFKPLEQESKAA